MSLYPTNLDLDFELKKLNAEFLANDTYEFTDEFSLLEGYKIALAYYPTEKLITAKKLSTDNKNKYFLEIE